MTTLRRLGVATRDTIAALDVQWGSTDWKLIDLLDNVPDTDTPAHEHRSAMDIAGNVLRRAHRLLKARSEARDALPFGWPTEADRILAASALRLATVLRAAKALQHVDTARCERCGAGIFPNGDAGCSDVECPVRVPR